MKKLLIALLLVCSFVQVARSQSRSTSNVLSMNLRNSGPVMQDGQVKGYYNFYKVEKQDRKNNNYLISLTDENLQEINTVNIVRPEYYILVDAVFNGTAFGFLFYDAKEKALELLSYDKSLKSLGKVNKNLENKYASIPYMMIAQGRGQQQPYLLAVPDKGFLYYGIKNDSKAEYEIEFYDNNMKRAWVSNAQKDKYDFESAGEAYQGDEYVGSLIAKRTGLLDMDIDFEILVQNVTNGQPLFRFSMETTKYKLSLTELFFDKEKQQFVLFAEYFDKDQNVIKSSSQGFVTLVLDMKGKIVSEKVNSWKTNIASLVEAKDKDKFDETSIMFHEFVRTSDGQFFAIGEQYKKSGVAYVSPAISIHNMVIFQFDETFAIKKVQVFPKDKRTISLPQGTLIFSTKLLGYVVKGLDGFDYVFTQVAPDKSTFMASYINYDREKGQKDKLVFGSIVYTPEKVFTVDKFTLSKKAAKSYVYQGKPGYVLVNDYYPKDKKLDSRLEKINY